MRASGVRSGAHDGRRRTGALHAGGLLAALVIVVAGCSSPFGGNTAAGGPSPSTTSTGSPAAEKVLEDSARQVRSQVDVLVQLIQKDDAQRQTMVDDVGACEIGVASPWPQRQGYAVMLTFPTAAPVFAAAAVLQRRLQGQGWLIRSHETTSDAIDFDARKQGLTLRVNGQPTPATVSIEGYGVCVGVEGKLVGA